jgi:hypothetical protein
VTEREFCRDLKLTWQAFGLDTPAMLEQRGVDVATLFGNVGDVIDISERFLDTLQVHFFQGTLTEGEGSVRLTSTLRELDV